MIKDYKIFLEHILESIEAVEEYSLGVTKKDFLASREKQDSILRRLKL